VGERVTRADEIHLAVLRKANTLSWPVKKGKIGQHVELASKKKGIHMRSKIADV
jgi:hypothetical protein